MGTRCWYCTGPDGETYCGYDLDSLWDLLGESAGTARLDVAGLPARRVTQAWSPPYEGI